jgi:hypothetical protein
MSRHSARSRWRPVVGTGASLLRTTVRSLSLPVLP